MKTYFLMSNEYYQPDGIALYPDMDEMVRAALACGWADNDDDAHNIALDMMEMAEEIELPDDFDIGNGYFPDRQYLN